MGPWYVLGFGIGTTILLFVGYVLLQRLLLPAWAFRRPSNEADQPDSQRNLGRALLQAGQVVGLFLVSGSVVASCVQGHFATDAKWTAIFGGTALVLYLIAETLGIRALLGDRVAAELARGNLSVGVAAGAHAIGTGVVVSRAIGGTDLRTLAIASVFFGISQISLHVLVTMFRWLTTYDDEEEILGDNLAAAISYGGITIAVSLIVGRAVEGQFQGWLTSLKGFGVALAYGFVLYPIRQIVVEGLLLGARPSLRAGVLDRAIGREKNVGLAAIEACTYIATALVILRIG